MDLYYQLGKGSRQQHYTWRGLQGHGRINVVLITRIDELLDCIYYAILPRLNCTIKNIQSRFKKIGGEKRYNNSLYPSFFQLVSAPITMRISRRTCHGSCSGGSVQTTT
jgi:hypothetical protein